jgi:hypothetical protein
MFGLSHFTQRLFVVLLCSLPLAACGDDEATEAGVNWLEENPQVPANSGWKIMDVASTGKLEFEIRVDLYSATAANKLNTLSAMDKAEVARLVCPIRGTEFWDIASSKATVVVKLLSMGKTQVTAICRR